MNASDTTIIVVRVHANASAIRIRVVARALNNTAHGKLQPFGFGKTP